MGAVGKATTIDYVQVSFSNDDAFEWFGGNVNCRHLVSYRNLDDDFDTDNGFSGNVQFCIGVRDPNIADNPSVSTSEGFESDNDATGSNAMPQTSAVFSNVTWVGPLRGNVTALVASGFRRGVRIRRDSALKIYNSIFMDGTRGIHIDGTACEANATNGTSLTTITNSSPTPTYGVLKFKNNLVAGYQPTKSVEVNTGSTFNITNWFGLNANDSLASSANILVNPYGTNFLNPDLRPITGSNALSNISFVDLGINTMLIGAPSATANVNYCVGATATALTATANNDCTLLWYVSATGGTSIPTPTPNTSVAGTAVYYVSQINADGYEGARTMVTVTVNALPATPSVTANGSTTFCTGGSVDLSSSEATGNLWSNGNPTQTITVSNTGSYSVTFTDVNGCSATSNAISVNVSNAPAPTINASATVACSGDTVVLTASTSDSYAWSTGETSQVIFVTNSASIIVNTMNANACNGVGSSAPIVITFNASPTAGGSFTLNGNVASFTNTSTGATSYSWDFGDQTNSSASAPLHAFAANGSYTVVLTAINGNCTSTQSFTINIAVALNELVGIEGLNIYPNPAKDLLNIDFTNTTDQNLELQIVDQFGRVILTNNDNNLGVMHQEISLANFLSGVYYLRLNSNSSTRIEKIIITK